MDAKYILLIQRQFDQPLSERETYELQGFLAGNEAAAKLCENVRRLLEECENVELPEKFKPVDAEYLLTEILSALTQTKSRSWFSFVKQFVQGKKTKPQITSAHQDELAVLRKHRATAEGTSKAMDALRAKVVAEVTPVTPEDAVSLAEAIKRRMLSMPVEIQSQSQHRADVELEQDPWTAAPPQVQTPESFMMPLQFNNAPPSISQSMDQLFSSSNWPVITPETVRDAEQLKEQEHAPNHRQQNDDECEFKPGPGPAPFASVLRNRSQQRHQHESQQAHQTQVQPTETQQHTNEHREHSAPGQTSAYPVQNNEPTPWPSASQNEWTAIEQEQMEPIWQLELEARQSDPLWPSQPAADPIQSSSATADPIWPSSATADPVWPSSATADPVWPSSATADPVRPSSATADPIRPSSATADPVWPSSATADPVWPSSATADPIWPSQPAAAPLWPTPTPTPAPAPVRLRPASLIPVDDIIAHVSHMFSEHIDDAPKFSQPARPSTTPPDMVPPTEDPLGASSGQYPQIREMDLRKANAARLGTTTYTDESNGQIKALGNFLLDKHSAAAIGNLSNAKANLANARILSDEEAQALQDCLSPIEKLQGVAGCIILGYDGMIIMSSLPEHADKDALSAWALLTYMNTHDLVRVVGHNRLRQFVSRTLSGYLLLADFGQGLLLTVSDNASSEAILPLMKGVRRVTAA